MANKAAMPANSNTYFAVGVVRKSSIAFTLLLGGGAPNHQAPTDALAFSNPPVPNYLDHRQFRPSSAHASNTLILPAEPLPPLGRTYSPGEGSHLDTPSCQSTQPSNACSALTLPRPVPRLCFYEIVLLWLAALGLVYYETSLRLAHGIFASRGKFWDYRRQSSGAGLALAMKLLASAAILSTQRFDSMRNTPLRQRAIWEDS